MAFAMALNCSTHGTGPEGTAEGEGKNVPASFSTEPCGQCRSCRKIESGNHPDLIRVHPTGAMVRIDQIRELCRILAMKPYEARYRVVVISEANRMNAEAGNALLKMLEEPPDRTILILTAPAVADVLPTIVSRCRHIRFNPIPVPLLARELEKTEGLDPESAYGLAVISGGSRARAQELSRNNWDHRRLWLMEIFDALTSQGRGDDDSTRLFAAASVISSDKDLTLHSLEVLTTYYRDMLVFKYQPDKLLNPDMRERIAGRMVDHQGEDGILDAIGAVDTTMDHIRSNANVRLALESLFLTLAKSHEMN